MYMPLGIPYSYLYNMPSSFTSSIHCECFRCQICEFVNNRGTARQIVIIFRMGRQMDGKTDIIGFGGTESLFPYRKHKKIN